ILIASAGGLHTFDDRGVPGPVHHPGRAVTSVAPARQELWAIFEGTEVWHAKNVADWTHIADIEHHTGTCITAVDDDVYIGSSEARLFRVAARGLEPVVPF